MNKRRDDFRNDRGMRSKQSSKGGNRAPGKGKAEYKEKLVPPVKEAPVKEEVAIREDLIEGRNAVIEALRTDRTIEQILIAKGDKEGSVNVVIGAAKEKGIVIKEVDRKKLDMLSETGAHQGVIAKVTPYKYVQVEDILKKAEDKGEKPFIIILDEIEDPHNFRFYNKDSRTLWGTWNNNT